MSDGANNRRRPVEPHKSWLHSEPARRARLTPLSPIQIVEQAVRDIRDNVRRNLEENYSSESSPEPELHPNVNLEREFSFDDLDPSIIHPSERNNDALRPTDARSEHTERTESRVSHRREFSLTSYDNSIFDPEEIYAYIDGMATQQEHTPRGEATGEPRITNAEIDTEIDRLRITANHIANRRTEQPRTYPEARDSVLDRLLEGMQGIQDRLSRLENARHDHSLRIRYNLRTHSGRR